ncbi:MAG: GNAT family N-acetyltransferase [Alphaproteobacteria bacterium]|nr:GNAT family N-acetyltransferase [Alphaproteobacteria bacterium]
MIDVRTLAGDELRAALPALAGLRIRVFREWPYLYDGTLEYEAGYLKKFAEAAGAVVVVARDGDTVVGASTASPLLGHADAFAKPFAERGHDPACVFYFGESVLLPEYRGHGIGVQFFERREAAARKNGLFDIATFCAVVRDSNDARKPSGYVPLDAFWRKRGFEKAAGLTTDFSWKEPHQDADVNHTMQFWVKPL